MAGLPGIRAGTAIAVSRLALTERIEETASRGVYQWEVVRRAIAGEDWTGFMRAVEQ